MPRKLKNAVYSLLSKSHCRRSIRKLKRMESRLPEAALRFAIPACFEGHGHCKWLKAYQHPVEIWRLYQLAMERKPRRVLEIGTARGGTLYLWTQAADPEAIIVSIDLPEGKFGGGYRSCRIPLYQSFTQPGQQLHLIRQSSRDRSLPDKVKDLMGGEPVDWLFIDADHRYEGVCTNLNLYAPLVRPGGLIVLHDILPSVRNAEIQVCRLWEKLKTVEGTREITDSINDRFPLGLGIIEMPQAGINEVLETIPLVTDVD